MDVRSFLVRDEGDDAGASARALSEFLSSVDVERMETAYDGGWRVIVFYQDRRRREEHRQIAALIAGALQSWRTRLAARMHVAPESLLSDPALDAIALQAPTTVPELRGIGALDGTDLGERADEILGVVRETLDELSGDG